MIAHCGQKGHRESSKMVFHLKAKVKLLRLDSDGGLWFVKSCLLVHFQQSDFRPGFPVAFLRKTHFRSGWTPGVFTIVSHTLEVVLRGIPLYLHAYPHDSHVFVPPPCHDASHLALTGCCVYDEVPRLHVVTHNWCCRPPLFEESLNQLDILLHSSSQREALSFLQMHVPSLAPCLGALSLGWCKFYQRASLYFQDNNSLNYFTSSWADMCTDRWPNRDWWAEWSWWMCCDELTVTGWAWLPSNNTLW